MTEQNADSPRQDGRGEVEGASAVVTGQPDDGALLDWVLERGVKVKLISLGHGDAWRAYVKLQNGKIKTLGAEASCRKDAALSAWQEAQRAARAV